MRESRQGALHAPLRLGALLACLSLTTSSAAGDPPPTPSSEASLDAQDSLARAKDLFRQGVALFQAGEVDRALDMFRRSRGLYSSAKNTVNAALCLERLKRYDEALELYETAITLHPGELDASDEEGIRAAMANLRSRVGNLSISYNVTGNVVVDGRPRGTLPLSSPLRVMPGRHVVRVLKDGYATYETEVVIRADTTSNIDARLEALTATGVLRVEDAAAAGAEVVVDGAVVGASPWEGILAPGTHVVQTRSVAAKSAEAVSPVAKAVVVEGQTTLLQLTSRPAGPTVYLQVEPTSAELAIDGVPLGQGRWESVLPEGNYVVSASELGYFAESSQLPIGAGAGPSVRIALRLRVDESHPRWPKQAAGHFWMAGFVGMPMGPSLHSGPESDCRAGCPDAMVWGFTGGARVGYELPWKLSIELVAGYTSHWSRLSRGASATYAGGSRRVEYEFDDVVRFKGPMVGAGASYPVPIANNWHLRSRISVGVIFASSLDAVEGTVSSTVDQLPLDIADAGRSVRSTPLFVMPELGVERSAGSFRLGASLGLLFVPQGGPDLPHGTVSTITDPCYENAASAACARNISLRGERAYGPFVMFVPSLSAAHVF